MNRITNTAIFFLFCAMIAFASGHAIGAEVERPSDDLNEAMKNPELRENPNEFSTPSIQKGSPESTGTTNHARFHGRVGEEQNSTIRESNMSGCMRAIMNGQLSHGPTYSDRAYLSGMIVHHEAAVDMAMVALRDGSDPKVLHWAREVIKTQEAEIADMRKWLQGLGGEDTSASKMMHGEMHAMMNASGKNADYDFVSMMIGHHAGAVAMASEAIMRSDNPDVLKLSRQIVDAQLGEIIEYRQWLKNHPLTRE